MLQFLQHVTIGVNWCWRRSSQGRNCWWTLQLDPGNLAPSLVLGASILPAFPTPEAVPRTLPWDSKLSLRPPRLNMWLNRIKASVRTFKILAGQCGDLLIVWLPKTSLKCMQIPLLIKPTTHPPEWSASLFGLSWLSVYQEPVSDFTWEAHEVYELQLVSQPGN